jgi:hypothetical protein
MFHILRAYKPGGETMNRKYKLEMACEREKGSKLKKGAEQEGQEIQETEPMVNIRHKIALQKDRRPGIRRKEQLRIGMRLQKQKNEELRMQAAATRGRVTQATRD